MLDHVRITDVAPRDGLQNESRTIATEDKVRLVELLCAAGVDEVEVSSFVSPRWIPQLADAAAVFDRLRGRKPASVVFSALVPNEQGMRAALAVNAQAEAAPLIDRIAVFTAASETFARKNTNASIAKTIERFRPVVKLAQEHHLGVRGYISCVVRCPFEGPIAPEKIAEVAEQLLAIGVDEIDLGETIGAGTPETIGALLSTVLARLGRDRLPHLTLHLHDTFGRAADCVKTALALGIRSFDGAAGGLGGCPYASTPQRRAPGNLATETLVAMVHASGYKTGVNAEKLAEAGRFARILIAADGNACSNT